MRLEQLEYVVAVTRYGSLRKASEQLHISQPALSEAVGKLERELGLPLLDRHRSGSRISRHGRDLLPHMVDVLESVTRLRTAAGDAEVTGKVLRIGTVNGATSTVLVPAMKAYSALHPTSGVEVLPIQQHEIHAGLVDGSLDLGLVNMLADDVAAPDLVTTVLLHGRPVAVLPTDHPLTARESVTVEELRGERFIAMRAGYLMHRVANRLFGNDLPRDAHSTDGADLGKLMVADRLGITLLPEFSVTGDPLHAAGLITTRPIAGDSTIVRLVLQHRNHQMPARVRELAGCLQAEAARQGGASQSRG